MLSPKRRENVAHSVCWKVLKDRQGEAAGCFCAVLGILDLNDPSYHEFFVSSKLNRRIVALLTIVVR